MKTLILVLLVLNAYSAYSFADQKLPQNKYGESMSCSYGVETKVNGSQPLNFSAKKDLAIKGDDVLVATGQDDSKNISIHVSLAAYEGSEGFFNVLLSDGPLDLGVGVNMGTVDGTDCHASGSLYVTLSGKRQVLKCTVYHSRLASKLFGKKCKRP